MKTKIKLGRTYRDRISGFEGVCTGIAAYITGCTQACLVPSVDEKGNYREGQWLDDNRLIDVKKQKPAVRTSTPKGGPQQAPPTR